MNELQKGMLDELVAVSISNKEEFDKVINFLSINNCFLTTGEPVIKLPYPGASQIVLYKQDNAVFWEMATQYTDARRRLVNTFEFFEPTQEDKVVEANAKVIAEETEEIPINEKTMTLTYKKKPTSIEIISNIDDLMKVIPYIEAKKNIVIDENNYKSFASKAKGTTPALYRNYAGSLKKELSNIKDIYTAPYKEFEEKIKAVANALYSTADVLNKNADVFVQKQKEELRAKRQAAINELSNMLVSKGMLSKEYADQFVFDEKWLNTSCSEKKFKEQVEAQFQSLIEKEKNDKLNVEMIEKTIKNLCYVANVDEKLISREKYQSLLATEGLPKVTEMISDEVDNIKKQSQAVAQQKEAEIQHQKEEFERKQKEAEIQHQKELEQVKKQASDGATQSEYTPVPRNGEIIANVNDKYIVTEIKETPEKYQGRVWKKTFEFKGDLAALQMLNRYMDVIKKINPTFSFGEVKLIEKELSDPQTGSIDKYSVKEAN